MRSEHGRAVLKQHGEDGRILRLAHRRQVVVLALDPRELLQRHVPGSGLEDEGETKYDEIDEGIADRVGVQQFLDALVDGDARADGEDQDGDDEGPEIQLHSVAEGMAFVGLMRRQFHAIEQKALIAGVDQGVNALRQHRGGAGIDRDGEFGDGDQRIAGKCGEDHLF